MTVPLVTDEIGQSPFGDIVSFALLPESTAVRLARRQRLSRSLTESLILAQDERWRRA